MENKSSAAVSLPDNTPADGATPMVRSHPPGPGPYVGNDGTGGYQFRKGKGDEGPGVGHAVVMNSDNNPTGPAYPNG